MANLSARALLGLFAIIASSPSAAQTQSVDASSNTVWNLDFQESHCTITTGRADGLGVSFWMTPGDPEPMLYVVGPANMLPKPRGKVRIEFPSERKSFDGEAYEITGRKSADKTDRVLHVVQLGHEFSAAFAASNELHLIFGQDRTVISTKGASKAFGALRKCVDETLPEWGVDPSSLAALRQPPTEIEGKFWISGADYPFDALRADWMGYLVVRLNVDATGDVTQCAVVVSSGWRSVDRVTCGNAVARARFHPAIGADGKPAAAVRTSNVVFRLAD